MSQTEQQLSVETLALHRQLADETLRANQGWARAEAKSRECIELRERMAVQSSVRGAAIPVQGDPVTSGAALDSIMACARPDVERLGAQITAGMALMGRGAAGMINAFGLGQDQGDAGNPVSGSAPVETAGDAGAAQTCRSSDTVQADQLAFELPTGARVIRNVGGNLAAENSAVLASQVLSVVLWLYRRLPRCYGRPPHIEVTLKRLARYTGTEVADCLAERGPDPASGGA